MSTQLSPRIDALVFIPNGQQQPLTDSFLVAQYFSKQHKNVLQKISRLECSPEFMDANFTLCHRASEKQNNKPQPYYQMTKDGFIFLAMGFTGTQAAAIKEKYIKAFNEMAERLTTPPQPLPLELFTSEDELMKKFMQNLHVRVLFEIDGGKVTSSNVVPENAFVVTKERLLELMENDRIFSDHDIVLINTAAANRIAAM
ncbi:TPA: Rha family transcriptional regulator [Vibrio harveyi]|nr:Rha family transcriptional regulator [Vibrio harveyi]